MDLSQTFATRSPWRLIATQGPPTPDGLGDPEPGPITVCPQPAREAACVPLPADPADATGAAALYAQDHEIRALKVVHARGDLGQPLLFLQTGSAHSGDGEQLLRTRVLAYRRAEDRFVEVYRNATGRNNNQETRFIAQGPLAGDIVSATPTEHAPYAYWIAVSDWTPKGYRPVLRYRSVTRYDDGDPLPVIDSEMAGIEQRLHLWRPGMPLPRPAGVCADLHLVRMELRCG